MKKKSGKDKFATMITEVSEAYEIPMPGWGVICKVKGNISPPGPFWNLQTFRIKNYVGNADHTNPGIINDVLNFGRKITDVNGFDQKWSFDQLDGVKCGEDNTVVVVAIWTRMFPPASQTQSAGSKQYIACNLEDCSGFPMCFRVGYDVESRESE